MSLNFNVLVTFLFVPRAENTCFVFFNFNEAFFNAEVKGKLH